MGMKAISVGSASEQVRQKRLEAAIKVVQAANDLGAEMILLTGDVFEDNAVDRTMVRKTGEILKSFKGPVYIIPGNHDPLVPGSVWEHSVWTEATNITVIRKSEPIELPGCILYPCPLKEKYSTRNPTLWIDAKANEKISIGLAHGNVEGIATDADYPIARDAAQQLGLDYLAVGHWHSFARYDDSSGVCRMAYSGTHETTKFGERESGSAILVEIPNRGGAPKLTPIKTGGLRWGIISFNIDQANAIQRLFTQLEEIENPKEALVRVDLTGMFFPEDRGALQKLEEILTTRFLFGALNSSGLLAAPENDTWLESLPTGHYREAALKLLGKAKEALNPQDRIVATHALLHLFELQERSKA